MFCFKSKYYLNWPNCSYKDNKNMKSLPTDRQTDRLTHKLTNVRQKVTIKNNLSLKLRCLKKVGAKRFISFVSHNKLLQLWSVTLGLNGSNSYRIYIWHQNHLRHNNQHIRHSILDASKHTHSKFIMSNKNPLIYLICDTLCIALNACKRPHQTFADDV